jgi:hypothetical protein
MPNIKNKSVEKHEIKPKLKPFTGGLAALQIQPDVKSEQRKFTPWTKSHHTIAPIAHDKYVQQPPEIKSNS